MVIKFDLLFNFKLICVPQPVRFCISKLVDFFVGHLYHNLLLLFRRILHPAGNICFVLLGFRWNGGP